MHDVADELERLASEARDVEMGFSVAAAEHYASLTPDFGEVRYNRLCRLAAIKRPLYSTNNRTTEITIVDDTTLRIGDLHARLTAEEIALLNRIVENRHNHLSSATLCKNIPTANGGYCTMRQSKFHAASRALIAKIKSIGGPSLLYHTRGGRSTLYVLSSMVQFVDERTTQSEELTMIVEQTPSNAEKDDVVIITTDDQPIALGSVSQEVAEVVVESAQVVESPKEPSSNDNNGTEKDMKGTQSSPPLPSAPSAEAGIVELDIWYSVDEIAQATGLPGDIVTIFIDRNKHRLGRDFKSPQMRPRPHPTARGSILMQCYSPQFSDWAIASLEAAKQRLAEQDAHNAVVQQDADHATPES